MKDRPIPGVGKTCPCGKAMFNRVARCNESTDYLDLHYDICPTCGFETYAHNTVAANQLVYERWRMKITESPTIQNVFAKELELIQDADIKSFVIDVFGELCPSYFWYIPASVRGHHPPVCRTRGGLVHHVKLAVAFADSFLDIHLEDDLRTSQVITATLLHDMMKRGPTENELDTWPEHRVANRSHGRYCANRLVEYLDDPQTWSPGLRVKLAPIITAIRLHMGRWTWELQPHEAQELIHNEIVRTTHLADYAASRALHQYLAERAIDPTMRYLND